MTISNRLTSIVLLLSTMFLTSFALADASPQPKIVGTWSLSLDAGPFGLPGFALSGIATFHSDGTLIFADAGDFGSLGTLDSNQIGLWKRTAHGVQARTLMLSAAPDTGEPMHWLRGNFQLTRGENGDHMVGEVNLEMLPCEYIGLPMALTCPDPVVRGDEFVPAPPFNIPIEFHRFTVSAN